LERSSHVVLEEISDIQSNEIYTRIMANMAIVPSIGLEKRIFFGYVLRFTYSTDGGASTALDWLIDRRWINITYNGNTAYLSLHKVVSDVVYRVLKPDSEKCWSLLMWLLEYGYDCQNKTLAEAEKAAKMLELACKRIDDGTLMSSDLNFCFARLSAFLGNYTTALKHYKKVARLREKLIDLNDISIGVDYKNIAKAYENLGDNLQATKWYKKANISLAKGVDDDEMSLS